MCEEKVNSRSIFSVKGQEKEAVTSIVRLEPGKEKQYLMGTIT